MKVYLFTLILFLLSSGCLFAQEITEDGISEIKNSLNLKLEKAKKDENFEEAAKIKNRLILIDKIEALQLEKNAAVKSEDYSRAANLKKQIQQLLQNVTDKNVNNIEATISEDGEATLVFSSNLKKFIYHVYLDNQFIGSIDNTTTIILKGVDAGEHSIAFWPRNFTNNSGAIEPKAFIVYDGQSVEYNLSPPLKTSEYSRLLKKILKGEESIWDHITVQDVKNSPSNGNIIEYSENIKRPDHKNTRVFSSFGIGIDMRTLFMKLPEGAEDAFKLGYVLNLQKPLSSNSGLFWDLSLSGSRMTYTYGEQDFFAASVSLNTGIGYAIELFDPNISAYSAILVGPTLFNPGSGEKVTTSFNGFFKAGAQVYGKRRQLGVFSDLRVGFSGGWTVHSGVVINFLSRKNKKYDYLIAPKF